MTLKEMNFKDERDLFCRLTENVEEASAQESDEIFNEIDSLSTDDLTINTVRKFSI